MVLDVSQAGLYLNRMLDYHDPEAIRRKYPALPFDSGELLPIKQVLSIGAYQQISQELIDGTGETVEFTSDLTDVPFVEVAIDEIKYLVQTRAIATKYTFGDIEKQKIASQNGQIYTDVVKERNDMAMRILAEYGNRTCAYGVPERGVAGVLNNPNVPIYNDTFNPYTSTDDDVVDWITSKINAVASATNLVENPNVLCVTKKLHKRICSIKPLANWSIKQSIMTTMESIKVIKPINELRFDLLEKFGIVPAGTNRSRIWIYNLDDASLKRLTSPVERMPLEYRLGTFTNMWVKSFAAPQIAFPQSMCYVSYPESSII